MSKYNPEYQRKYRKEHIERKRELARASYHRNKDKHKADKYGHYSKKKKCFKCNKPIVNASKGFCLLCTLTKESPKDLGSKLYRERNPEKTKARKAFASKIQNGLIKRENCKVCGKKNAEAHHEDYSKPLDVIWLCKTHHTDLEWHKKIVAKYLTIC